MSLKGQAITGVKWTSIASIVNTIVQMVQLIILARILDPTDFGLMALVMVVIGFSQIFIDMGISNAIIYKQDITDAQLNSLYWLNVMVGVLFFLILFLTAPMIASFYENEKLVSLIYVVSATFLIKPWGQQSMILLQKKLHFSSIAKTDIISNSISFVVVILLAFKDFGVYSLAIGAVVFSILSTVGYIINGWKLHRPKFLFNFSDLSGFLNFGLFQMGEKVMNYFSSQFDTILIGKLFGVEILGIYNVGKNLVMKPAGIINPVVTKVTFPLMSKVNNDIEALKKIFLKITSLLSYVNIAVYFILAAFAKPVIIILLGNQWIDAVPIVQILSFTFLLRALNNPSGSLLLSQGKANIAFYWKLATIILYPVSIMIGSVGGVIGVALSTLILQILLYFPNWKFIIYRICKAGFWEYSRNIIIPFLFVALPVVLSMLLTFYITNPYIQLFSALVIFSLLFLLLIYKLNSSLFIEFRNILLTKKIKTGAK